MAKMLLNFNKKLDNGLVEIGIEWLIGVAITGVMFWVVSLKREQK